MTRVKRTGVRTRTLGTGWEERFLTAVRKAREQQLIPAEQAEKLRRLAGAYFCVKCKQEHRTESTLGKQHLRLQPKQAEASASEPAKGKPAKPSAAAAPKRATVQAQLAGAPAKAAAPAKRRKAR
jgi:hypothetical protein